jgi:LysM repeat protein
VIGVAVFVSVISVNPATANAGFLNFVSDLFNKSFAEEENVAQEVNSQNMKLLEATLSSDPSLARGGGDIMIVGGTALLPEAGPAGTLADIAEQHNFESKISIYVVRQGDSLSQIAKMFGVSVNTIVWGNDIKNGVIAPGQTLAILPISGVSHTVKSGDTVKSIATKYKADIDEIIQYNNLTLTSKLTIGEVVVIPDGEIAAPVKSSGFTAAKLRGSGGPDYGDYYLKPVAGARKTQGLHGYNGIDFGAPVGTPVLAAASGDVIISRGSGWNGGYGQYLVIQHDNNTQTLYSHLSKIVVTEGYRVVRGQVIGYVGSTGKSTGPHLHFEVRGAKNPF